MSRENSGKVKGISRLRFCSNPDFFLKILALGSLIFVRSNQWMTHICAYYHTNVTRNWLLALNLEERTFTSFTQVGPVSSIPRRTYDRIPFPLLHAFVLRYDFLNHNTMTNTGENTIFYCNVPNLLFFIFRVCADLMIVVNVKEY